MASVPPRIGLTAAWPSVQAVEARAPGKRVEGPGGSEALAVHGADFIGAPCAPTLGPAAVSQICAQSYPGSPVTQACAGRAPGPGEPAVAPGTRMHRAGARHRVCRRSRPHWSLRSGPQAAYGKGTERLGLGPLPLPQSFSLLSLAQEAAPVTSLRGQTDSLQEQSPASQCVLSL